MIDRIVNSEEYIRLKIGGGVTSLPRRPSITHQYNAPVFRPSAAAVPPSDRGGSLFPPLPVIPWSCLGSQSRQQRGSRTTGITPAGIWSLIETGDANTDGIKPGLPAGCEGKKSGFLHRDLFQSGEESEVEPDWNCLVASLANLQI